MTIRLQLTPEVRLSKFKLKEFIGRGYFSEVWVAQDVFLDREVAVKVQVLSKDTSKHKEEIERILFEARIGNHLTHDNLMRILSVDSTKHADYQLLLMAMQYYPNGSAVKKCNNKGFIPFIDGIKVLIDALKGLEHLHENNLVHGDIKPQNIIIGDKGEGIISDYGISRYAPDLLPVKPRTVYRLHEAPETMQKNQISVQTDIYQMGMTAFRIVNGDKIVRDILSEIGLEEYRNRVMSGKLLRAQHYLPFIPSNLKRIIGKSIHVDSDKRFKSALEMRRALEKLSYSGDWTSNSDGEYVGVAGHYEYSYKIDDLGNGIYNFIALKKNRTNDKETMIHKFCSNKICLSDLEKRKNRFFQSVITGILN